MSYAPEPDQDQEARDQREFDEAVAHKGKYVLEAIAGLGILAAILMSAVALVQSGQKSTETATPRTAVKQAAAVAPAPSTSKPVADVAEFKIIPSAKKGPDGKMHDAFMKTEFAVKVGQPLTLKVDNTDNAPHSITSPVAGVNVTIQPGVHTYTFVVNKAGRYLWYCMVPCDSDANGWAMQHPGFMSGYITAS